MLTAQSSLEDTAADAGPEAGETNSVILTTDRMAFEGACVGRIAGKVCFVRGALPGERVEARILRSRARYEEAELVRVLEPSPHRAPPDCPSFGDCGGCDFLHWDYAQQTIAKKRFLEDAFRGLPEILARIAETVPSPAPWYSRNRMAYSVSATDRGVTIGFHSRRDPSRLVSAESCRLQSEAAQQTVRRIREALESLPAAEAATFLRLEIREGKRTGQRLIHLYASRTGAALDAAAAACRGGCDTLVASLGDDPRPWIPPRSRTTLWGEGRIFEQLGGFEFEIGPDAFFQVNSDVAESCFRFLREEADRLGAREILELYAGSGVLACFLAAPDRRITGFEADGQAVAAAARNLEKNGIRGVRIHGRKVEQIGRLAKGSSPDLVIADPPRAGLSPEALRRTLDFRAPHLILMSCHPVILARDVRQLMTKGGYRIRWIRPFDMFPQTTHVETLAGLSRDG